MSRVPILFLFTVSTMTALGQAQTISRTSRAPSLGLSRLDMLSGPVVAADFNGDGIIDLAASAALSASGNNTSGATVSANTTVNPTPTATAAAATPNVAVFGNSVSVPNAPTAAAPNTTSTTSAAGFVPAVPNAAFPLAQGSAGFAAAASTPVASSGVAQPNVAVFGNSVTVPNATAPVSNNAVTVPSSAFVRGAAVPGLPASTTTGGGVSPASAAQTANSAAVPNAAYTVSTGGTAATNTSAAAAMSPTNGAVAGTEAAANVITPENSVAANTVAANAAAANGAPANTAAQSAALATTPIATTAAAPGAVQTGFNGATAANAPGPVVVMLGTGNGTFKAPIQSWISGTVLGAGDFNRDQKTDLVVLQPDNQVIVMQGKGDGTFPAAFPGGSPVTALAGQLNDVTFAVAADVDGDGRLDLIVGANPNAVRVFPGRGDFTFGTPVDLVTAESPSNAVVADINGDRRNDIVVADRSGQALSMFLNQGALLFTAADVPLDRQITDVAAADLNRDGKIDLVVTAAGGNNGGANIEAGASIASGGASIASGGGSIASGGASNAAAGGNQPSFADGFVYVLLGRGDGTFAPPVQYAVLPGAWRIALGDFNGDGTLDIATANRSASGDLSAVNGSTASDSVSILQGNPDGTFAAASMLALAAGNAAQSDARFRGSVRSLSVSDVNRDKAPDLIVSDGAILMSRAAGSAGR
jgi:VCBS repeat protein